MNVLTKILVLLGLRKEANVETITRPMAKIVTQLQTYAENQTAAAAKDAEAAAKLRAKSDEEAKAAMDARALSDRYAALTI